MKAKERLYSTVDGRLVREGDPAGAYLKFAVGDDIGTDFEDEVNDLTEEDGTTSMAYHDDDARDVLRARQAEPSAANRVIAANDLADDPTAPVLLHDRLATELADEARERANMDEPLELSATATRERLFRTEDDDLVLEGDVRGRTLAYAPGDKIRRGDVRTFKRVMADKAKDDESTSDDEKVPDPVTPDPSTETPPPPPPVVPETPTPAVPTPTPTPAKATTPAKRTPSRATASSAS